MKKYKSKMKNEKFPWRRHFLVASGLSHYNKMMYTTHKVFLLCFFLGWGGGQWGLAQKVEWAMTNIPYNHAGTFCNGIATLGSEYQKETKIINRRGEEIGKAQGKIIYADDWNWIILKGGSFSSYLTDAKGKILSKKCNNIVPWRNCFACEDKKGQWGLVDRTGKVLLKFGDYFFMGDGGDCRDYIEFSHDGESLIFDADGRLVFRDSGISQGLLTDASPLIYGINRLYVKSSGKSMELNGKRPHCHSLCNYFVLTDIMGQKREYFDFNCRPIGMDLLAHNRKGITVVPENGQYTLVDASGEKISAELDDVSPLLWVDSIMPVKSGDKWGYISEKGEWIIRPQYETADPFIWGIAMVNKDSPSAHPQLIDTKGNVILNYSKNVYEYYVTQVAGKPLLFYQLNHTGPSWGYHNLVTRRGVNEISTCPNFQGEYAIISSTNGMGVCRSDGQLVLPCKYDIIRSISEGVIVVNDKFEDKVYDLQGKLLLNGKRMGITIKGPFCCGVAPVFVSGIGKESDGYIYNIYGRTLDETLSCYGQLGKNAVSPEMNELMQQRLYFVDYHQNMGGKNMEKKQYNAAIHHFDCVIAVHSMYAPSLYGKGVCLMETGRNSEAIEYLERSLVSNPLQEGCRYTLALCYYQGGNYSKAVKNCSLVSTNDVYYNDAQQLKNEMNNRKQEKRQQRMEVFMAILSGLNQAATTLQSAYSSDVSGYAAPVSQSHSTQPSSSRQRECSSCHGTGYNSARERPAFYSYNEELYESSLCEICGSHSNHYHKPCSVCRGKGYVNF